MYSRGNFVAILCTILAEIYTFEVTLEAAILDFPLPVSSRFVVRHYHYVYLIDGPMGIAVGISMLSCVQAEIIRI